MHQHIEVAHLEQVKHFWSQHMRHSQIFLSKCIRSHGCCWAARIVPEGHHIEERKHFKKISIIYISQKSTERKLPYASCSCSPLPLQWHCCRNRWDQICFCSVDRFPPSSSSSPGHVRIAQVPKLPRAPGGGGRGRKRRLFFVLAPWWPMSEWGSGRAGGRRGERKAHPIDNKNTLLFI